MYRYWCFVVRVCVFLFLLLFLLCVCVCRSVRGSERPSPLHVRVNKASKRQASAKDALIALIALNVGTASARDCTRQRKPWERGVGLAALSCDTGTTAILAWPL